MRAFIVTTMLFMFSNVALAGCTNAPPCDPCGEASEYSWNPSQQYTTDRLKRFYAVNDELEAAYKQSQFDKAKSIAQESLALAEIYRCNWNYGNVIHDANRVLGLISLKEGDVEGASGYLAKAGDSSGSPQLDTFGPELDLASELLQRGRAESVKAYLLNVKKFWKMDDGKIDRWISQIDKGEKPALSRFEQPALGPLDYALVGLFYVWPLIVSGTVLTLRRKHLKRQLLFFTASSTIGYLVLFGGDAVMPWLHRLFLPALAEAGETTFAIAVWLPVLVVIVLPVASTLLLYRFFRRRERPL